MDRNTLLAMLRAAGLAETLADELLKRGITAETAPTMLAGLQVHEMRARGAEHPVQMGQARFLPQTLNQQTRTVTICWTTGARGLRYDWESGRFYWEELEVSERAIRLGRLNNGAPLLDTHQAWELRNQIGVSEKAWIKDGEGLGEFRFSKRPDVEPYYQDVVDGIIRNSSVRYIIHQYDITRKDGELDVWRAIDWEPVEVSLVPVPFDAGAQVRAAELNKIPCTPPANPGQLPSNQETKMDRNILLAKLRAAGILEADIETLATALLARGITEATAEAMIKEEKAKLDQQRAQAQAQTPAPTPEPQPAAPPAVAGRAAKASEIRAACEVARMSTEDTLALVTASTEAGHTMDQVRTVIFERMAANNGPAQQASVQLIADETEKKREVVSNAILHRMLPGKVQLLNGAGDYRHMRLLEIGAALLRHLGRMPASGLPVHELAARVLTSSDFPYILANVANTSLRAGYESEPRTFVKWCRQGSVTDFKTVTRVQMGDAPDLKKVLEGGQITLGSFGEAREQFRAYTYARGLRFSREMLINDDLGAFNRMAQMFGNAGARLEGDVVWEQVTSNPTMGDGHALFGTTHANVTAASSLVTEAALNAMDISMGAQTTIDGNQMNLEARFLLLPRARVLEAKKQVTAVTPANTSDVNAFAGRYELVPESRLDATPNTWYGVADPNRIDTIEYGFLDGANGMIVESQPAAFDSLGVDLRAIHDFFAKAIDHRGFHKNGG